MNKNDTILGITLCFTLTSIFIIYIFNELGADTTDNEESNFLIHLEVKEQMMDI